MHARYVADGFIFGVALVLLWLVSVIWGVDRAPPSINVIAAAEMRECRNTGGEVRVSMLPGNEITCLRLRSTIND